ncbi:FAD-dependent monooxygenase [Streptomyces sp. ISL-86]|uniref:FAD-dependent monooxygenase n=1 Tax=Streptomyces sp. ISL-86 TaxID=2819187 RepID=UPI001BEC5249|nr:FAD-dependent monooxygenase [Streptomyces sp. ISL-86]MBT2458876.1 FAD-dependent monooxygenase [Streptomyces sp. ISL-86]
MTQRQSAKPFAIVLGGGLAGTLAAAALAPHVGEVLIIERDNILPDAPAPRPRLPQAAHTHILWQGGAEAMEKLLPGLTKEWLSAGAHRVPVPTGMVSYSPAGWYRRSWDATHYLIAASRDLLDWVVRTHVLSIPNIRIRTGVKTTGLAGDAKHIRGVRTVDQNGAESIISANLVIDATGRGSRSPQWLRDIGGPAVRETTVDAGVLYASRRYRAPEGAETDWPAILIQADLRMGKPGQLAGIMPIEGGEWSVSLSGTRGGEPPADESLFEQFARDTRHPLVAEFLARTEPMSGVTVYGQTTNRRRHYEKADLPAGFAVLGDAATSLNPVYAHGMTAAALGAVALRATAERTPVHSPRFGAKAQRKIAGPAADAWLLAVGQDQFYPHSVGKKPTLADQFGARYIYRLNHTATDNALVVRRLTDVMTMKKRAWTLIDPRVLLAAARGPRRALLDGPPLTEREQSILHRTPTNRPRS